MTTLESIITGLNSWASRGEEFIRGQQESYSDWREKRKHARLLFDKLRGERRLDVSAMWYYTREQTAEFVDMMQQESQSPDGNTAREVALLQTLLRSSATIAFLNPDYLNPNSRFQLETDQGKVYIPHRGITVVDLGCGDGTKATHLLKSIDHLLVRYVPIDASRHMMNRAAQTVRSSLADRGRHVFLEGGAVQRDLSTLNADLMSKAEYERFIQQRLYWLKRLHQKFKRLRETYVSPVGIHDETFTTTTRDAIPKVISMLERRRGTLSRKDRYDLYQWQTYLERVGFELGTLREESITDLCDRASSWTLRDVIGYKVVAGIAGALTLPLLAFDYASYTLTGRFALSALAGTVSPWYNTNYPDLTVERLIDTAQKRATPPWYSKLIAPFVKQPHSPEQPLLDALSLTFLTQVRNSHSTHSDKITIPNIQVDFFSADFPAVCQKLDYITSLDRPTLYALLGQTLGNFKPKEQREFIHNLYHAIDDLDFVLIGVELRPASGTTLEERAAHDRDVKKMVSRYRAGETFLRKSTRAIGIPDGSLDFEAEYKEHAIELGFRVKEPIHIRKGLHTVSLKPNDYIPVAYSYKFEPLEVVHMLADAGFGIVNVAHTVSHEFCSLGREACRPSYTLVLAQKHSPEIMQRAKDESPDVWE